jgi:hypothetical protein
MNHGGKVALLGIPPGTPRSTGTRSIFKGLDHQGRLRPRDVRDLVQDGRHAAKVVLDWT